MRGYNFSVDRLRLNRIYESDTVELFRSSVFKSKKIEEVYGKLLFPPVPEGRPYIYASFVSSIDGKIGFPGSPDGSLIAKSNTYDSDGGVCDFWILNMLRSISDAVVMGGMAIRNEPNLRGVIFDDELLRNRVDSGRFPVPLNVVITESGNIPLNHRIVVSKDIPLLIVTTSSGKKRLSESLTREYNDYGCFTGTEGFGGFDRAIPLGLIAVGDEKRVDISLLLKLFKKSGINMLLVESPTLAVYLMREKLIDEVFLNLSAIFVGGDSPGIGKNMSAFTVDNHPHAQVLTVHSHSDYFFYFRYKMHYG